MRRKLPSTQALVCFETAARHRSFTRAAQELALTQGAISRQVAALEEFLGTPLFARTQHGMSLTPAGLAYAQTVRQRLNALERDTLDIMSNQGQQESITIASVPTFAVHWLIPRLTDLRNSHPQLTVHVEARTKPFLFQETEINAAIFSGTHEQAQSWAGTEVNFLMAEQVIPVCSPALLAPQHPTTPEDLLQLPLLQQSTRPDAWLRWFEYWQLDTTKAMSGPRFEQYSMQLAAAKNGLGVALVPTLFVEDELKNGSLCIAYPQPIFSQRNYYFVETKDTANSTLSIFKHWLLDHFSDQPTP